MKTLGSTPIVLLWAALAGWAVAAGCGETAPPGGGSSSAGAGGAGAVAGAYPTGGEGTGASGAGASGGGGGGTIPTGGWQPVPWLASCSGERLDLATESWPTRQWQSCGSGCLEASALNFAAEATATRYGSGATTAAGSIYYRTSVQGNDHDFEILERLPTGEVLLVLRVDEACIVRAEKAGAPFVVEVTGGSHTAVGRFDPATAELVGAGPYPISQSHPAWFTFTDGWGLVDADSIRVALDPTVAELTTLHSANNWQWPARGRGELVAWIDWAEVPSPIRSWTLTGGKNVLVSQPWDIVILGLGEEVIAWVGATGPETLFGLYETARLYWSPFTTDPAAINVSEGPDLTGDVTGLQELVVSGDHVAMGSYNLDSGVQGILVARMSTAERWLIRARPGTFLLPVAISGTEMLATETDETSSPASFDRYLRLDLAELDSLAQGWSPP